jgi:hypothetical protein
MALPSLLETLDLHFVNPLHMVSSVTNIFIREFDHFNRRHLGGVLQSIDLEALLSAKVWLKVGHPPPDPIRCAEHGLRQFDRVLAELEVLI